MEYIEDWVERALSCFYKESYKDDPKDAKKSSSQIHYLDPLNLLDDNKLKSEFEKFVEELGLNEDKRQELFNYPREKKITLLTTQNARDLADSKIFISLLHQLNTKLSVDVDTLEQLQNLVITLRTQGESFIAEFINSSGLDLLISVLEKCHQKSGRESCALLLICSFRALLNSTIGRQSVLNNSDALQILARSISLNDAKCKVISIEVLSGLCFVPEDDGHAKILAAISEVSALLGERTRFQCLLNDLHKNFTSYRESDRVRTAILGLLNALLSNGSAQNSVEFRTHLRFELLMLGISTILDNIREDASSRLDDHIDLFEMMRKEDELALCGSSEDSGASSPVDFESVVGMAEALHEKLSSSLALPHFISLLQHLFMVPCDEKHTPLWKLFDLILQQLTLESTVEGMTDSGHNVINNIDMNTFLSRLQTQCELEKAESDLEKLKEELEHERTKCIELENKLADYLDGRSSISSRISTLSSSPSDPCPSPTPTLPPVCPTVAPPPPPPFGGIQALKTAEPQKKVPTPGGPLKSFNWNKLTSEKVKGSIWENVDDEKIYKQIDLSEVSTIFASTSNTKDDDTETIAGTLRRNRETQVSVIDSRRYQNCTIMLSKLKLTHKEIRSALMNMDEQGKLPKDMLEQMLKFVPTREEINLLNETVSRSKGPTVLALADRYLFEMAQIPRFEQRLRCLHHIRTFNDRVEYILPLIQAVTKASTDIVSNKRFKQLLTVVLALGNYLNYGKRNGNAYGFDLYSLNRISDVKYSTAPNKNLLHYIISWTDRKSPDIMKLRKELATISEAARCSRSEVLAEIRSLEQAIAFVRAELNHVETQRRQETPEDVVTNKKDRFMSVAKNFITTATNEFNNLENSFKEMTNKFTECTRYFCFDSNSTPEEFFSVLAKFFNSLSEHYQQYYWSLNEEKEKVKRETLARSYFTKKSKRNDKERDFEQLISALQSGDIFKEELSRLRTSFRMSKRSRIPRA
ncbi:unnamed protein product [Auanema sp. JU1783]|nr:unnamed protein product [Auanema sp. JU1783]